MDWENAYRQKDTPWDKGAPSPGLVDFLETATVHGNVLVPGCGFGHDVRAIAALPDTCVTGIDISPTALEKARKHKGSRAENFLLADLFALPETLLGTQDWVWEHTCFCAIPPTRRKDYVRAVRSSLRPGGHLAAIFFLDPGMPHPEVGPPFGVTTRELDALFQKSGAFELMHEWEPKRSYPGREGRELMRLLKVK
jgi:SAM-dependent methyltransferase